MQKLPIVKSVLDSFGFGFSNIWTTIRLGWLGLLLYIAAFVIIQIIQLGSIDAFLTYWADYISAEPDDVSVQIHNIFQTQIDLMLPSYAAMIFLLPFTVIITRLAAEDISPPSGPAYLKFGGREVRYFFGAILLAIITTFIYILAFLPAGIALGVGMFSGVSMDMLLNAETNPEAIEQAIEQNITSGSFGLAGIAGLILGVLGLFAVIWFSIRIIPFFSVISVENKVAFFRSLKMTKGNFWRIFASILFYILMIIVSVITIIIAIIVITVVASIVLGIVGNISDIFVWIISTVGVFLACIAYLALISFYVGTSIAYPAQIYKHLKGNAE